MTYYQVTSSYLRSLIRLLTEYRTFEPISEGDLVLLFGPVVGGNTEVALVNRETGEVREQLVHVRERRGWRDTVARRMGDMPDATPQRLLR